MEEKMNVMKNPAVTSQHYLPTIYTMYTHHLESHQKWVASEGYISCLLAYMFWDNHFGLHCMGSHFVSGYPYIRTYK